MNHRTSRTGKQGILEASASVSEIHTTSADASAHVQQVSNEVGHQDAETVNISDIRIDSRLRGRIEYHDDIVSNYASLIKEGHLFPHPVLTRDNGPKYWIADGYYRIKAYLQLKKKTVKCIIRDGDAKASFIMGLKANANNPQAFTREEKRKNARLLLQHPEWGVTSSREIGRLCGITHKTVDKIRHQMNAEIEMNRSRSNQVSDSDRGISRGATDLFEDKWKERMGDHKRFLIKSKKSRGYHVVGLGDSTDESFVSSIFGENRADLLLTDPPYNTSIPGNRNEFGNEDDEFIENNKFKDATEFEKFLRSVLSTCRKFLNEGASYYVWTSYQYEEMKRSLLEEHLGQPHAPLLWIKRRYVHHPHYKYKWRHESCTYGWVRGQLPVWLGGPSRGNVFQGEYLERSRYDAKVKNHPCSKPVLIIKRFIMDSLELGKIVYDCFLGSGSTLIAAEISRRLCYGIELVPEYLAVTLERAEDLGLEVIPVPNGVSISEFIKSEEAKDSANENESLDKSLDMGLEP